MPPWKTPEPDPLRNKGPVVQVRRAGAWARCGVAMLRDPPAGRRRCSNPNRSPAALPRPQLEAVSCGYRRSRPVLRGVTLCVEQGERVALVGPNGEGKSTLVKTIIGEVAPLAGTVQTHG